MFIMGGGDPAGMMVGMAVGRVVGNQVAGAMNDAMNNMEQKIPPVPNTAAPPAVAQYSVAVNGETTGPFDMNTLARMARNNQLTPQSLVWKYGMTTWTAAGSIQELAGFFPPALANTAANTPATPGVAGAATPAIQPGSQYQKEHALYDDRSFFSIDRLVKFGMTTAVAEQMVNSMNHTIRNMQIPGAGNPMIPPQQPYLHPAAQTEAEKNQANPVPPEFNPPDLVYYAMIDGKQAGPYSETELARLINDRKLSKDTYIWYPGLGDWNTAENIPMILRLVALVPPPPPQSTEVPPPPPHQSTEVPQLN